MKTRMLVGTVLTLVAVAAAQAHTLVPVMEVAKSQASGLVPLVLAMGVYFGRRMAA